MEGFYAEDKVDALNIAKKLFNGVKFVGMGGSVTVDEIGLHDELKKVIMVLWIGKFASQQILFVAISL